VKNFIAGKKIILGVSGSISAYKALLILRLLTRMQAEVRVILTPSACRFIPPLNFEALSHQKVFIDLWEKDNYWSEHIQLAAWADLFLIAPCSLNTLSKLACGICDNALLTTWFASKAIKVIAPAMEENMYYNPIAEKNIKTMKALGVCFIEPEVGELASGKFGAGRLAEPDAIIKELNYILAPKRLSSKKILLTAGPTQERIDPVRFISNHSTGKMGLALADTAHALGGAVSLILGPTALQPAYKNYTVHKVTSAQEMFDTVLAIYKEQDVFILSAAVSDYKPLHYSSQKIKKTQDVWELSLVQNSDILKELGKLKQPGQTLIGFALETENGIDNARKKLIEKNADFIILNYARYPFSGFGSDTNEVTILSRDKEPLAISLQCKENVAYELINYIASYI
jgi:phosphopantothenoylcysteine decarboxylase/phosphopantothenate--cysteine ligase